MIMMCLWLVAIMFDINYLLNKILLMQSWKARTKQLRIETQNWNTNIDTGLHEPRC